MNRHSDIIVCRLSFPAGLMRFDQKAVASVRRHTEEDDVCVQSPIGPCVPCRCEWVDATAELRDSAERGPEGRLFFLEDGQIYFSVYKDDPLILALLELGLDLDVTRISTIVRHDIAVPNIHICMANVNGTYVLLSADGGREMLTTIYGASLQRAIRAVQTDIPFRP